jgi:conjugative relaxase-like TrwC/TraI family protein
MSLVAFGIGGCAYVEREIAGGLEDYYAGRGEAPGEWVGSGAAAIGLTGQVEAGHLALVVEQACHPLTGEALGRPHRSFADRQARCGFGLTFSAPKSVSVLWAVAGAQVAQEVRAAHVEAVGAALAYLECHATFSRRGKAGVLQVDTDGLVAAAYVHRSSRAMDPQLHTHVVVANRVRCADGAWRALDARELYGCQKAAGAVYQVALRSRLTRRLGAAWTKVDVNGQADVLGVPEELCDRFSTRRHQVEQQAARLVAEREVVLGRPLTAGERAVEYQTATYITRPPKAHDGVTDDTLVGRWEAEADELGLGSDRWLGDVVGRAGYWLSRDGDDAGRIADEVVAELAEDRSAWSRAHATHGVARRLGPVTGVASNVVDEVEGIVDVVMAHPEVVRLAAPPSAAVPEALARRDGRATMERHGGARYTTRETLRVEGRVLDAVSRGRDTSRGVADPAGVAVAIGDAGLSADQTRAVRRITASGDAVECVVGPAGAGKTRALAAARAAWEASGHRVRGLAVSAVAAGVLASEAGIPADTIAKFLLDHGGADQSPGWRFRSSEPLAPGEVVVVDEGSMVASRDLLRLVEVVEGAGGKLVLIGDHHQLGAVEAGGLFRLLAADGRTAELEGVRRFVEAWEGPASLRVRAGDPGVIDTYASHGRVHGGTRAELLDTALDTWLVARRAGETVAVVAADHATVDALAARARQLRVASGEIEAGGVNASGQTVGVGDEIVTCRNDRRVLTSRGAWVRNGDRWRVTARTLDGGLTIEHMGGRGRALLPAVYVAEHVALSYSVTVHKTQGLTVDRCLLLVDEHTTAEHLYVGLTRGRLANHALVVCEPPGWGAPPPTPMHELTAGLARSQAERSATETLTVEIDRAESLRGLYPAWLEALAHIDAHAGPDRRELEDLRAELDRLTERQRRAQAPWRSHDEARKEHGDATAHLTRARSELAEVSRPRGRLLRRRPDSLTLCNAEQHVDHCTKRLTRANEKLAEIEAERQRLRVPDQQLDRAQAAVAEAEAAVGRRGAWLAKHPAERDWEADLRQRIIDRTGQLANEAARTQPRHIVGLLGPLPPAGAASDTWIRLAGAIEAHRERFDVDPDRLGHEPDMRGVQGRHWQHIQLAIDDAKSELQHTAHQQPDTALVPPPGHGQDIGVGF